MATSLSHEQLWEELEALRQRDKELDEQIRVLQPHKTKIQSWQSRARMGSQGSSASNCDCFDRTHSAPSISPNGKLSTAPGVSPGAGASPSSTAAAVVVAQQQEQIARLEAEVARQQAELAEGARQQAALRAENQALRAQLEEQTSTATTPKRAVDAPRVAKPRRVDAQKTAKLRSAANEIISAMGTRGSRRKKDALVVAAEAFADGSQTFNFGQATAAASGVTKKEKASSMTGGRLCVSFLIKLCKLGG